MSQPGLSESAPAAPPLALRRLPLPRWEPPYDDEVVADPQEVALTEVPALPRAVGLRQAGGGPAAGLALALPLELPAPRRPRSPLRLVPDAPAPQPQGPRVLGAGDDDELPRTPRARLPEPRAWAGRFVQVLLEVLAGERPASQVMRHVSLAVHSDLLATPHRPTDGRGRPASAATVTSLRVTEPADGVAEVCAVTRRGDRYRALALRLEGQGGRWRCVALEVG